MELPNKPDFAVTKAGCFVLRERSSAANRRSIRHLRSRIKRAQNVQQGTFTRARLAHDSQHLSLSHLKRQVFKEHESEPPERKTFLRPSTRSIASVIRCNWNAFRIKVAISAACGANPLQALP